MIKTFGISALIASLGIYMGSLDGLKAISNERPGWSDQRRHIPKIENKINTNNKSNTNTKNYENSINIEGQLRDILGINSYPEKRTIYDSVEFSEEHERLRRKMLMD